MTKREHKKVLALVNQARKALGAKPLRKLPKGELKNAASCPIFKSIPQAWGVYSADITMRNQKSALKLRRAWNVYGYERKVDLPAALQNFITEFDHGRYPELIKQ